MNSRRSVFPGGDSPAVCGEQCLDDYSVGWWDPIGSHQFIVKEQKAEEKRSMPQRKFLELVGELKGG